MKCPTCGQETGDVRRPLTPRQRDVFAFLRSYEDEHHVFPTHQDIADALNLRSLATVYEHLENLANKGWIVRVGDMSTSRAFATVRASAKAA